MRPILLLLAALTVGCQTAAASPPTQPETEPATLRERLESIRMEHEPALIAPETSEWVETMTGMALLDAIHGVNALVGELARSSRRLRTPRPRVESPSREPGGRLNEPSSRSPLPSAPRTESASPT